MSKFPRKALLKFIQQKIDLYVEIIEPLGQVARERNDDFTAGYSQVLNKFSLEFGKRYCQPDGSILWKKLVKFNSGKKK